MSTPVEQEKTKGEIFFSGGVQINIDLKSDEGQILMAHGLEVIPEGTRGWAVGATYVVDNEDGTSKAYINVGDETGSRHIEIGKQTTSQENFPVYHNASILSAPEAAHMSIMFNMKLSRGTFGVGGGSDEGGSFSFGDDGGIFIFSGAAIEEDHATVIHDATPPGVKLYAKIVGKFIQLCADLSGSGMTQFQSANGGIFLVHDDPNADLGVELQAQDADRGPGFVVPVQNGRFYIRDVNGKEFTVEADNSSSVSVYFDKTAMAENARLFADLTTLGAADLDIDLVQIGGQQNTSDGVASIKPFFDEDAELGEQILHGFPFVPINFTADVFGSNKLVEIFYNPNAESLGVDFFFNKDTQRVEADLPSEEDSFFTTSARFTPMQNVTT